MKKGEKHESFRDKIQDKWAETFVSSRQTRNGRLQEFSTIEEPLCKRGILHLSPRSGKIRTSLRIFEKFESSNSRRNPRILICYPDKNIQKSWEDDIKEVGYENPNINYVTHISLSKEIEKEYDIIVNDEIHLLSEKQKRNFKSIMKNNPNAWIVGLSGTLSKDTELDLKLCLGLEVICKYPLEEAIRDGIISDYKITVITTPLDDVTIVDTKKNRTEKSKFNAISWVIKNKGQSLFLNLARMRIIQGSIAKLDITKKLLKSLKNEKVLVFCANNKIAKELGCKIHTSLNNNQKEFEKFISNNSKYKHFALCKIGNTGVSFKALDHILISAFDSNAENLTQRICRSLILDEKDKVSNIFIVSSEEDVELRWLKSALEFFDKNKIKYL